MRNVLLIRGCPLIRVSLKDRFYNTIIATWCMSYYKNVECDNYALVVKDRYMASHVLFTRPHVNDVPAPINRRCPVICENKPRHPHGPRITHYMGISYFPCIHNVVRDGCETIEGKTSETEDRKWALHMYGWT